VSLLTSNLPIKIIDTECGDLVQRFMVWCRAGLRGDYLSVYADFFYEPQTLENH